MFEGKSIFLKEVKSSIFELCFSAEGSVNKLDMETLKELGETVSLLEKSEEVKGLVITSDKSAFIVGADINEFTALFEGTKEDLIKGVSEVHNILNRLEDLPFPKVAAINGFALGGGFELALTAEYRVCSDDAVVGFPEVKLGIIPGYGGTVRAPRLMGCDNAVEWICSGKQVKAKEAFSLGAVDSVVSKDQLKETAIAMIEVANEGKLDFKSRREEKKSPVLLNDMERLMAFTSAGGLVSAQAGKHYPAPMSALKAIEKHVSLNRDEAIKVEMEHFSELAFTDVARSLIGLFLSEQYVSKKAKSLASSVDKINNAAVLGAGIMGGGIAYQSATKGMSILMKDIAQAGLDAGISEASSLLSKRVDRGRISTTDMAVALTKITPTLSYEGFPKSDIVVEAVVENTKIKQTVLAECEEKISDDCVLSSNTSTIEISELAKVLKRPEKFCGMHFFNPVHRMPLVEVIRGKDTDDETISTTVSYALSLGKTPVVVNDCAGFFVNRVLFPYLGSANTLISEGFDFQHIDKIMERWGWPMGPAYLQDVVGIDTCVHASQVMASAFPERMKVDFKSPAEVLFEAKRFGQKNEIGFYKYITDKKGRPQKQPDPSISDLFSSYEQQDKLCDDSEIIDRLMIPMALEVVRCLDENIVASPAEADIALIMGIGFPPFHGGICRYLDNIGIKSFVDNAKKYSNFGPQFEIPESLIEMARTNKSFY